MNKEEHYTADQHFYDLQQLQSYCEIGMSQSYRKDKEKNQTFYASLYARISQFIDDGERYIAIAGDEEKTALHCINTHEYEFVDEATISDEIKSHYIPRSASIEPIGGKFLAESLITETQKFLDKKAALVEELGDSPVTNILKNDISAKEAFIKSTQDLAAQDQTVFQVPLQQNATRSNILKSHIQQLTIL